MGLRDRLKVARARSAEIMANAHYEATVNKGSIWMRGLNLTLNARWNDGWKLAHIIEQSGNTVLIWERREGFHAATVSEEAEAEVEENA